MNISNIDWSKDYDQFLKYLYSLGDLKYKEFTKKITPGEFTMIGINIPILKSIAKDIRRGDYSQFLKVKDDNIYEVVMIKLLVVSNIKDISEYKRYFEDFILKINNWALCDTFVSASKIIKKDNVYFFNRARELIKEKSEFKNRIGFVILLDYFVNEEYISKIIDTIKNFKSDAYYANMALAWLISLMYTKYPSITQQFLLNNNLGKVVVKMSIRKIKDSRLVSYKNKEWLSNLRIS